ncbi:hypothetical protein [Gimesia sp.]|uniref:hypothetical protein n=1 Tax=Gimesia sp. TaxID=2024833 RepID=UPI0032EF9F4D
MNRQLETEIFQRFIQKAKVDRFLWMLESPGRRRRIFDDLRDLRYFNRDSCEELTGAAKESNALIERLTSLQVRDPLYLICSDEDYDGTEQGLIPFVRERLWQIDEVIGYCRQSCVGFFKNHEGWFYILSK